MSKIAMLFAGQGAQSPGMGKALYEQYPEVRPIFDLAADYLPVCFEGPKEALTLTSNAQPCLFAVNLACARVLARELHIEGVAGFSLGEIPAAAFCGLMSDAEAFELVLHRARAMQACAQDNPGRMFAVIKLTAQAVEDLCAPIEGAYPINYNAPGQTVVACLEHAAENFPAAVAAAGGRALPLAVGGAFHCPAMDAASASLAAYVQGVEIKVPTLPLYANATAQPYPVGAPDDCRALLAEQVHRPVLWQKTIEHMLADGFDTFVEAGPGQVLSRLVQKIAPEATVLQGLPAQLAAQA